MLGLRLAQCSRVSAPTTTSLAASLHSSAVVQARKGAHARANLAKRDKQRRLAELSRPHVILGHKPGDDNKWKSCDLAKVLVTPEEMQAAPPLPAQPQENARVQLPKYTNFGLGPHEKEILFETLPAMSTEGVHLAAQARQQKPVTPTELVEMDEKSRAHEQLKVTMLARIVDLRNANARGIAYENRRRCIQAFSPTGDPDDTGRPEVQAAILTMRIRNVWEHLNRSKKDVFCRRSLRTLVHKRAKVLKYLKRTDRDKYDLTLEQLGLEPGSVEGELVV